MKPTMIKIGAAGEQLPAGATNHVAVLLPEHGLMFTRRPVNTEEQRQTQLAEDCKACRVAGFSDWRLPEIDELQLVIDRTRREPPLDPDFFSDIPIDWLWSNTAVSGNPDFAWLVGAGYGLVDGYRRSYSGFALAVRSAGQ